MVNAICKNPRVKWIYTRNEAGQSRAEIALLALRSKVRMKEVVATALSQMVQKGFQVLPLSLQSPKKVRSCEAAKQI